MDFPGVALGRQLRVVGPTVGRRWREYGLELIHDALGRTEPNAAGTAPTRKVRDTGHRRVAQRVEIS
jgi:hypothetical protein